MNRMYGHLKQLCRLLRCQSPKVVEFNQHSLELLVDSGNERIERLQVSVVNLLFLRLFVVDILGLFVVACFEVLHAG
jgi:hypothetical protein